MEDGRSCEWREDSIVREPYRNHHNPRRRGPERRTASLVGVTFLMASSSDMSIPEHRRRPRTRLYARIEFIFLFFIGILPTIGGYLLVPRRRSSEARLTTFYVSQVEQTTPYHDTFTLSENARAELMDIHCAQNSTSQRVFCAGYISKRRPLGSSLVFLDVIVQNDTQGRPVSVLLKRDAYKDKIAKFGTISSILQPGTWVSLWGHPVSSQSTGEVLILTERARLEQLNRNPQHLRKILEFTLQQEFSVTRLAELLSMDPAELQRQLTGLLQSHNGQVTGTMRDALYDLAKTLLEPIKRELLDPSQLMGSSKIDKLRSLPAWSETIPSDLLGVDTPPVGRKACPMSVRDCLDHKIDKNATVTVRGWVQSRQRFQDSATIIELVDSYICRGDGSRSARETLRCYLHPSVLGSTTNTTLHSILLSPGASVQLSGSLQEQKRGGKRCLWVTSAPKVHSVSSRIKDVRFFVEAVHSGSIQPSDASVALNRSEDRIMDILKASRIKERQWIAAEISKSLEGKNSRRGRVSPEMERILRETAQIRETYPIEAVTTDYLLSNEGKWAKQSSLLKQSILGSGWDRGKLPQLQIMTQLIEDALRSHPDFGTRRLSIVDIGGGQGHLANYVASRFSEHADVQVVDISHRAIQSGSMRAQRNNLRNLCFQVQDATELELQGKADLVVALHACGALSDVVIAHAVTVGASFVICPCCYRSNRHLQIPVQGARTKPHSFLQMEETFLGQLQFMAEIQGDFALSSEAAHAICSLRARAASRIGQHKVKISSFPVGLSQRNLCLVGHVGV